MIQIPQQQDAANEDDFLICRNFEFDILGENLVIKTDLDDKSKLKLRIDSHEFLETLSIVLNDFAIFDTETKKEIPWDEFRKRQLNKERKLKIEKLNSIAQSIEENYKEQ